MTDLAPTVLRVLPEAALFLGAVAVLLSDAFGGGAFRRGGVSLAALVLAAWAAFRAPSGDVAGAAFRVDALTTSIRYFVLVVLGLTLLFYHPATERLGISSDGAVLSLLLFSAGGLGLVAGARDLVLLVVGIEIASLPLYALAGLREDDPRGREAGLKYLLLGGVASAVFLLGVAYVAGATGSTRYDAILAQAASPALLRAGVVLVLVGLAFKAGAVPFHAWVPDVYVGSPTIVTAYMATAVKAGAFAALARLALHRQGDVATISLLAGLAALSLVLGNAAALLQDNFKRLLAYSSIAHTGFALMAVAALAAAGASGAAGRVKAQTALLFYLATYAVAAFPAFLAVAFVERDEAPDEDLVLLAGLAGRGRGLGFALFASMAGLAGLPPLVGVWGKVAVLDAAFSAGFARLAFLATLTQIVAMVYYARPLARYVRIEGRVAPAPKGPRVLALGAAVLSLVGLLLAACPDALWVLFS